MWIYILFCFHCQNLRTKNEAYGGNTCKILDVLHPNPVSPLGNLKMPSGLQWQWNRQHFAKSQQGIGQSEIEILVSFWIETETYLHIDCGGCHYLILIVRSVIPNLLHDLDGLLGRHIPGISHLTNKGHIQHNKHMAGRTIYG